MVVYFYRCKSYSSVAFVFSPLASSLPRFSFISLMLSAFIVVAVLMDASAWMAQVERPDPCVHASQALQEVDLRAIQTFVLVCASASEGAQHTTHVRRKLRLA